jgi:hypothetical protein
MTVRAPAGPRQRLRLLPMRLGRHASSSRRRSVDCDAVHVDHSGTCRSEAADRLAIDALRVACGSRSSAPNLRAYPLNGVSVAHPPIGQEFVEMVPGRGGGSSQFRRNLDPCRKPLDREQLCHAGTPPRIDAYDWDRADGGGGTLQTPELVPIDGDDPSAWATDRAPC